MLAMPGNKTFLVLQCEAFLGVEFRGATCKASSLSLDYITSLTDYKQKEVYSVGLQSIYVLEKPEHGSDLSLT